MVLRLRWHRCVGFVWCARIVWSDGSSLALTPLRSHIPPVGVGPWYRGLCMCARNVWFDPMVLRLRWHCWGPWRLSVVGCWSFCTLRFLETCKVCLIWSDGSSLALTPLRSLTTFRCGRAYVDIVVRTLKACKDCLYPEVLRLRWHRGGLTFRQWVDWRWHRCVGLEWGARVVWSDPMVLRLRWHRRGPWRPTRPWNHVLSASCAIVNRNLSRPGGVYVFFMGVYEKQQFWEIKVYLINLNDYFILEHLFFVHPCAKNVHPLRPRGPCASSHVSKNVNLLSCRQSWPTSTWGDQQTEMQL